MTETTTTETELRALARTYGLVLTCDSQAALPAPLRTLHRAVLTAFVDTGGAPTTDWVAERATALGLGAEDAVAALAKADLVHVSDGRAGVAYPFSGTPTPHVVRIDDGPATWAMCAVDAVGIPLMTGRDAEITSADAHTGEPIRIRVQDGGWTWDPAGTVTLVAGREACGTAAEGVCGHIHFFTGDEHARAYLAADPTLRGRIFDQAASVELADLVFGRLLADDEVGAA
jgi:hypothetical protein